MDYLRSLFQSLLQRLGLASKDATLVLLGLDNAGKTTLLYRLKNGAVRPFAPTQRANIEEVDVGALRLRAWDLGGHAQVRHLWRQYLSEADAVVFMVDSADTERIAEARRELQGLLAAGDGAAPVAVLANKIDLEGAMTREVITRELGLDTFMLSNPGRAVQLFPCSLVRGVGFEQALKWIGDLIP
eukprot:TRINITY_DN2164_c0_g1_i2.p1 TRINITY_DN2164_c0_g1~~TRINITY_DN2164_c0_g1_i2.p1  ORF type:complete len:186 (+),score=61.52 TRINITY_DN2164_c0_g1_i2:216-773(+)